MAKASNVVPMDPQSDYPLANTEAARLLAEGFKKADEEKNLSQRQVAKMLGYKTSVVLSHMALGRAPIPIDRSMDISRILGMDHKKFLLAVLDQRHPEINFKRVLGVDGKSSGSSKGSSSYVLDELESIAGMELDHMDPERVNIMREVCADKNAAQRWLTLSELPLVKAIRKMFPAGLSAKQRQDAETALSKI